MELSALPGWGPQAERLEGRTEGARDGKVAVRLSTGSVVEIATHETWAPGTPVTLAAGPDGKILILPKAVSNALADVRKSLWEALERLVDKPAKAKDLAQALAKNDYAQAATLLEPQTDGTPSSLLSQPARISPPATNSVVDLLYQSQPGKFQARVAGVTWELWSSPDLATPQKFSAKASMLPNGSALWTASALATDRNPPSLPETVRADPEGARLLLESAGFPDAPPELAKDLAAYLGRIGQRLLDARDSTAETGTTDDAPIAPSERTVTAESASASKNVGGGTADTGSRADTPSPPSTPPASPRLDAQTALRALVAWSLELDPQRPDLATLLGKGRALPEALENLRQHLALRQHPLPELSATLARVLEKDRLDPRDRADLEEKILHALSAPGSPEPEDSPLNEVSRALLGERLGELGRDAMARGETMWIRQEASWHQEQVVVRDRRKRGRPDRPDHHVATVRMEPKGAGPIDARLAMDGRNLSVRMETPSAETARRLENHLSELRSALDRTGLSVAGLEVARTAVPGHDGSKRTGFGGGFDVRA